MTAYTIAPAMRTPQEVVDSYFDLSKADLSREHKLAMADSIIYATARAFHATLWTQDAHFAGLEYVEFIEKKK